MEPMTPLLAVSCMLVGAAAMLLAVYLRGKAVWKDSTGEGSCEFGRWLGKECMVLKGNGWRKCKVVAVSHKGSIAVRNVTDGSGKHAKWIDKEQVPESVRWLAR